MAHREICAIIRCPEKTHSRLRDKASQKRVDLCVIHSVLTKRHYGDKVEVIETWGPEDVFDDKGGIIFGNVHLETKEEAEEKSAKSKAEDIVKGALQDARS